MKKGSVKFYNELKGFGFIIEEGASPDDRGAFIHATVLEKMVDNEGNSPLVIRDGDKVEYEVEESEKGLNVVFIKPMGEENDAAMAA